MTATTISTGTPTHRMSLLVRDAFHVRSWLAHEEIEPQDEADIAVPQPRKPSQHTSAMLTTFAGRYGGRY